MDESNILEETRNSEHPPWYGITQFEEKIKGIFLENQKGLHLHQLKTHIRMPVKREMTSGPFQETSFSAITLNPESNFTRQEKNHSLFHWSTLTFPEQHIHLRGKFFIEPNDEEFKHTMKAARRKLEVPMQAAMLCKIPIKSSG